MPRTKKQPTTGSQPAAPPAPNGEPGVGEVLTLAEAAAYLRLPEADVVRLVTGQDLPGRLAGTEWRFLKSAIREWLSKPIPKPSREAQLAVIGSWKDDPYLDDMLKEIYRRRGRPMTEEGE
jgi:excisionase family DNA binding protein